MNYRVEKDMIGYWVYYMGDEIGFAYSRREAAKLCREDNKLRSLNGV